jgi:hypothetical protein
MRFDGRVGDVVTDDALRGSDVRLVGAAVEVGGVSTGTLGRDIELTAAGGLVGPDVSNGAPDDEHPASAPTVSATIAVRRFTRQP